MNRNLLVIHLVLAAAASRKPDEEEWLVRARLLDADEVGRRADELTRSRRADVSIRTERSSAAVAGLGR